MSESTCRLCHCWLDAPNRHDEILGEWVIRAERAEGALRRIADSEDGYYMACSGTPFCRKGEPDEHSEDCAVRIIHDALNVKP